MGGLQPRRPWLLWGAGISVAGLLAVGTLQARDSAPPAGVVALAALPAEAQSVLGPRLVKEYKIADKEHLTSCSVCHR